MKSAHVRALCFAVLAYLVAVLALHPFADVFYGGDDWAYGWSVQVLLEQGKLRASSWVAAAAVTQTFWAAGFAAIFGVHPGVMNAATLVASTIGVPLLYLVFRNLGLAAWLAALATVIIAVDPLYLGFAASFMSDSYYAVLLLAATLAYLKALGSGSPWTSALGGVFASLALLNRQIGLVMPPALVVGALAAWFVHRLSMKRAVLVAAAGASLPLLVLVAYRRFPDLFGGVTTVQRLKTNSAKVWARIMDFGADLNHGHSTLLYAGVFTAPIAIMLLSGKRSREVLTSRTWRIPFALLMVASLAGYVAKLAQGDNLIVRGEFLQTGSFGAPALALMDPCWEVLAFFGSVSLPIVFILVAERIVSGTIAARRRGSAPPENEDTRDRVPELVFLSAAFTGHLLLVASFVTFYNNYFLPLVLFAGAMIAGANGGDERYQPRRAVLLGGVFSALTAIASVVVLDAHFRYVEADARVADSLVASGMDSRRVFGFCSWYAWKHYDLADAEIKRKPWGPLERLRDRAPVVILNPEQKPRRRSFKRVRSDEYRTLLGRRRIDVWEDSRPRS